MQVSVANIVAFFVQELRSARRSMRTWVFAAMAVGLGAGLYLYLFGAHGFGQTSAPRLNVPGYGALALWVLLLGVFSLTFDGRSRDQQALIADALDARPFLNFELIAGRLLAVAVTVWLALLALALLVVGFESFLAVPLSAIPSALSQSATSPATNPLFGGVSEPAVGLATFVFLDAPPALLFWGALTALLGSMLRYRVLTLLAVASLLALYVIAIFHAPLFLLPVFSGIANLGLAGSDVLPQTPSVADVVQRVAVVALALACLLLACSRQPRRDAANSARWGAAFAVVGFGALGALAWLAIGERSERRTWAAAHAAVGATRTDLERLAGHIRIDPGRELALSLDLHVMAKEERDVLTFSLNPAMRVGKLHVDGAVAVYSHDLGLLEVVLPRPLSAGERAVVHMEASGVPDHRFAYLDSAVDVMAQNLMGSPLALLGEQASLFLPNYVALMPGARWLPRPGANWGGDDTPDFHHIDLAVSLPVGWWPAGAGRMGASAPWRFRTTVPLADFALIAAPFERRALSIAGVDCELLAHPKHMRVFEVLSAEVLETTVSEFLRERLTTTGLDYPHRTLSVVEAPAQLRRYGGGWRMGTLQGLPGVQMLAEHGLPTARFSIPSDTASTRAQDALLKRLDELGANRIPLSAGFAGNLLPFLTSATGDGAFALNYLLEALTARVALGAHVVAPAGWVHASVPSNSGLVRGLLRILGTATVRSAWFEHVPESAETRGEGMAMNRIDPRRSPSDVDVLIHKGEQLAALMEGVMGNRKTRAFLALMRQRHAGATFTTADFMAALRTVEPTLPPLIEHFLDAAALPGFRASSVRAARIRDDENGQPRYQLRVDVRNDEPAAGVAALSWRTETEGALQWHFGTHAVVPGRTSIEIGATSLLPPLEARLETYLSRNRRALLLPLPHFDHAATVDWPPLDRARPSSWMPREDGIVIDDLDPGFSVTRADAGGFGWSSQISGIGAERASRRLVAPRGPKHRRVGKVPADAGAQTAWRWRCLGAFRCHPAQGRPLAAGLPPPQRRRAPCAVRKAAPTFARHPRHQARR